MAPNCPWAEYTIDSFPSCEKLLCTWIRQPLNTWSNLAFIGLAVYFIFFKKNRTTIDFSLGVCSFIIGGFSFLAHASQIAIFGALDFISIFLILSFILSLRETRLNRKPNFRLMLVYFVSATALSFVWPATRNFIFAIFIVAILAVEFRQRNQLNIFQKKRAQQILLSFTVGAAALAFDSSKAICFESNHFFQLHAIWHFTCALSMLLTGDYLNVSATENAFQTAK